MMDSWALFIASVALLFIFYVVSRGFAHIRLQSHTRRNNLNGPNKILPKVTEAATPTAVRPRVYQRPSCIVQRHPVHKRAV